MKSEIAETAVQHGFGGEWTTEKLVRLQKYLEAYQKVLRNQPYKTVYIVLHVEDSDRPGA